MQALRNTLSAGANGKWYVLFALMVAVYLLVWINRNFSPRAMARKSGGGGGGGKEGFANGQTKRFESKTGTDVYDDFYADVYDELFFQPNKLDYEVSSIIKEADLAPNGTYVLDIGSGRGHFVDKMKKNGYSATGLEKSKAMIDVNKRIYPESEVKHGDAMDPMSFPAERFTVITCLTFTVYYMQDKRQFFDNCYQWLSPGGYLVVHLVDRSRFDPMVPAGKPFFLISPQSQAKKRITGSSVKFETFQYKSDFHLKTDNDGVLVETFTDDDTGKIRQNIHNYDMPSHKAVIKMAKETGFIVSAHVDLVSTMNEYQYLYFFKKPN
jgi:SAM-dependent methyltransferase